MAINPDQLDPRNNLQWYTKDAIKNADVWTPQQVRREYSRLRDIAEKRLKRLAISEPESYAYRHNVGKYAPARGQSTEALAEQMPELARFIAAKTGSVKGIRAQRNKAVATLQERGYDFVTPANIKEFGEFMEASRETKLGKAVYTEIIAAYRFMQEQNIPWARVKEDFAQWVRARKNLDTYIAKQNAKGKEVTSDDILAEFDRMEAKRKKKNEANRRYRQRKKEADGG